MIKQKTLIGRGAFHMRRRLLEMKAGADGKADAGMSNDNEGLKPSRRKTKDS